MITGASGLICSSFIDLLIRYNEQGAHISIYAMSRNEEYAHKRFDAYWDNPLFTFIRHDVIEPLPWIILSMERVTLLRNVTLQIL